CTGEMGIGNTTAAAAITATLTGAAPEAVTGRGAGVDDAGLAHKIQVVRQALAVNRPDAMDGLDVLAKVGGFELGGLAGVMLGAAARRIPIVLDDDQRGGARGGGHTDRDAVRSAARQRLGTYGRLPFYARMFADA